MEIMIYRLCWTKMETIMFNITEIISLELPSESVSTQDGEVKPTKYIFVF